MCLINVKIEKLCTLFNSLFGLQSGLLKICNVNIKQSDIKLHYTVKILKFMNLDPKLLIK